LLQHAPGRRAELSAHDETDTLHAAGKDVHPVRQALEAVDEIGVAFVADGGEHHAAMRANPVWPFHADDAAILDEKPLRAPAGGDRHAGFHQPQQELPDQRRPRREQPACRARRDLLLRPTLPRAEPAPGDRVAPAHPRLGAVALLQPLRPAPVGRAFQWHRLRHAAIGRAAIGLREVMVGQAAQQAQGHACPGEVAQRNRRGGQIGCPHRRQRIAAAEGAHAAPRGRDIVETGEVVAGHPEPAERRGGGAAEPIGLLDQDHRKSAHDARERRAAASRAAPGHHQVGPHRIRPDKT
jgi:hypothetical protein